MPIKPFDEVPQKQRMASHSTGSLANLTNQFVQGIYLSDDKAMYSNFAKVYGTLGTKSDQLNFGAEADVKESALFEEQALTYSSTEYINKK